MCDMNIWRQESFCSFSDLCTMDENGCIKVVGRKKDMVIRGGENLFPIEVENFLHTHPAILEVQVSYSKIFLFTCTYV